MRALLLFCLWAFLGTAKAQLMLAVDGVRFSDEEKARIVSHGPWPPAARRDPSNRVSGRREAIELGERLFFEPRLSGTGSVLCATCHAPFRAFQDGRARAFGLEDAERNTPSLFNVGFYRWYGWDGGHDSLWSQSIRPLLDPREMRATPAHVANAVRKLFPRDYEKAFGRSPPADDDEVLVDVGKALAAFQETLVSARTPFDEFRDALARDDQSAMMNYPAAAQRGLQIFVGKGNCSVCHFGPQFTTGTRQVAAQQRNFGEFRVPGLRNVARTAPYMHDGSFATLREVVKNYSEINEERLHADGEKLLRPLNLPDREVDDLVVFLESLSSGSAW
jgi:cytochrome c peroxidase